MQIVDANIILRYLLNDQADLHQRAAGIIEGQDVWIPFEVVAEVVYVLEKLYGVPRNAIKMSLQMLISCENISVNDKAVLEKALQFFSKKNIDFVDALLLGYNHVRKHEVFSFDKGLNKLLLVEK